MGIDLTTVDAVQNVCDILGSKGNLLNKYINEQKVVFSPLHLLVSNLAPLNNSFVLTFGEKYVCRTYARIKHILTWHVPLVSSIGGGSETKKEYRILYCKNILSCVDPLRFASK